MEIRSIVPRGENLRRAVRWMSGEGACDKALVDAASVRFDLSPLDEEFLLAHFVVPERGPEDAVRPVHPAGGYRDMAVHLDDSDACSRRLAVAADIARRFDAYLTGIFVERPEPVSFALNYPREIIEASNAEREARREALKLLFFTHAEHAALTREWRIERRGLVDALAHYALYRDLLVIGRSGVGRADEETIEVLTLAAGRPVIVVPPRPEVRPVGRRVLIAWTERREAARAVAGALPLLRVAESVEIFTVQSPVQTQPDLSGAELRAHLSRHDVDASTASARAPERDVGEALLERVAATGADLVVMGAYGHARLREVIFGGATRELLENGDVPLLMCH